MVDALMAMGGGAVMGHVFKMMSAAQEAKRAQQDMMMQMMKAKTEQADAASERATKAADAAANRVGNDPFSKLTRRIFVLSVVAMVFLYLLAPFFGLDVAIPVEKQTGFNFLGLIDTTKTVTEYIQITGAMVSFNDIWVTFVAAGSFYLGKS